jgi:hypothetical protein
MVGAASGVLMVSDVAAVAGLKRLVRSDGGDRTVKTAGFFFVADPPTSTVAPPLLCVRTGVVDGGGLSFASSAAVGAVGVVADSEPDGEDDDELVEPEVEPEVLGSANAAPGIVAKADPTPSATASAPIRPTEFTFGITTPRRIGLMAREEHYADRVAENAFQAP